MQTTRTQKAVGIGLLLFCVLMVFLAAQPPPNTKVSILFVGHSNVLSKACRSSGFETMVTHVFGLILTARSTGPIGRKWSRTDSFDTITDTPLLHQQSFLIAIPPPSDAKTWKTSFTYQVRPPALERLWNEIRLLMPGRWVPDNSFHGTIGPVITNSLWTPQGHVGRRLTIAVVERQTARRLPASLGPPP